MANYGDIIKISESAEPKKDGHLSRKQGSYTKAPSGASFGKDSKLSHEDNGLEGYRLFQVPQERKLGIKYSDTKTKVGNGFFKVSQLEEPSNDRKDKKSIRQIRIRHSDLNRSDPGVFLRYWIKVYDLVGLVRDSSWLLGTHVFVDRFQL